MKKQKVKLVTASTILCMILMLSCAANNPLSVQTNTVYITNSFEIITLTPPYNPFVSNIGGQWYWIISNQDFNSKNIIEHWAFVTNYNAYWFDSYLFKGEGYLCMNSSTTNENMCPTNLIYIIKK